MYDLLQVRVHDDLGPDLERNVLNTVYEEAWTDQIEVQITDFINSEVGNVSLSSCSICAELELRANLPDGSVDHFSVANAHQLNCQHHLKLDFIHSDLGFCQSVFVIVL